MSSWLDIFGAPWFLLLGLLMVVVWWRWFRRGRHATIRFSSIAPVRRQGGSVRTRMQFLVPLLRSLAIVLLAVALARPQKDDEQTRIFSEGIAIELIVDRSGSMEALDFILDRERVSRLDVVKRVVQNFIVGNGDDLPGRGDDLVGLITFAGFADTKVPLTLDHATLTNTLEKIETPMTLDNQRRLIDLERQIRRATQAGDEPKARELKAQLALLGAEDGTAIGDAIALGVEKLRDLDRRRNLIEAKKIKSKIIVLLTDGLNNKGDITPEKAAEIAAALDIKVYTIGAGTDGQAPMPLVDMFGRAVLQPQQLQIDEDTLKRVADITGGQYFRAVDTESLTKIYAQIDELERVEIEEKRYRQKRELATAPIRVLGMELPSVLLTAFIVLGLEVVLVNSVFRKVP